VLTLEIERLSDPIKGALRRDDGTTHKFDGWLGLATALEQMLADTHAARTQQQPAQATPGR
jgi:hypothetical protein